MDDASHLLQVSYFENKSKEKEARGRRRCRTGEKEKEEGGLLMITAEANQPKVEKNQQVLEAAPHKTGGHCMPNDPSRSVQAQKNG